MRLILSKSFYDNLQVFSVKLPLVIGAIIWILFKGGILIGLEAIECQPLYRAR